MRSCADPLVHQYPSPTFARFAPTPVCTRCARLSAWPELDLGTRVLPQPVDVRRGCRAPPNRRRSCRSRSARRRGDPSSSGPSHAWRDRARSAAEALFAEPPGARDALTRLGTLLLARTGQRNDEEEGQRHPQRPRTSHRHHLPWPRNEWPRTVIRDAATTSATYHPHFHASIVSGTSPRDRQGKSSSPARVDENSGSGRRAPTSILVSPCDVIGARRHVASATTIWIRRRARRVRDAIALGRHDAMCCAPEVETRVTRERRCPSRRSAAAARAEQNTRCGRGRPVRRDRCPRDRHRFRRRGPID